MIMKGTTVNNLVFKPLLYKGSFDSNKQYEQFGAMPSPKFFSEIQCVKDNINIKIQNKNLCFNEWESGQYSNVDGTKQNNPQRLRLSKLVKVEANTSLYFNTFLELYNFVIRTYDKHKNMIRNVGNITNNNTLTLNDNENYISCFIHKASGNESTETSEHILELIESKEIKPFICLSSVKNKDYVEYKEEICLVSSQKEMLEGDYFTKENEVHTWGKIVLTGDEDIGITYSTPQNPYETYRICGLTNFIEIWEDLNNFDNLKSTHFKTVGYRVYNKSHVGLALPNTGSLYICSDKLTIEEFKKWLKEQYEAGTPVTIYYKLSEEERLQLTEEQKAVIDNLYDNFKLDEGVNYIYSDDEVSPIFSLNYMQSNKILNQKRDEKIKNLENRLNLLEV